MDLSALESHLGTILSVIGLLLSIYFYIVSKKVKEPRWFYATLKGDETFDKPELDQIRTTYIWFWNAGKEPILSSDIPATSKLKLALYNTKGPINILNHKIVKISRTAVKPKVSVYRNKVLVDFNFLGYKDGFAIKLQHTGNKHPHINFEGIILGVNAEIKMTKHSNHKFGDPAPDSEFVRPGWKIKSISLLIGIFSFYFGYPIFLDTFLNKSNSFFSVISFIAISVSVLIVLIVPWTSPFPFPKTLEFSDEEPDDK